MKKVNVILLLIYLAVFADQPVHLHFLDSIIVNDAVVVLGDIAQIKCPSDDNMRLKLAETRVGDAAPAGFSRYMTVYDVIQYVIAPQYKNLSINTTGAKRIKIRTDAKVRCVGDYENQILEYLHDNICWDKDDYTVSIQNSQRQWRCYRKPFIVSIEGLSTPYPKGNVRFILKITQGSWEFTVPVVCKVKVQAPVVSVAKTLQRNQVISKDKLELIRMDITTFRYDPYTDISSVAGKVAVKTLSPGTIVHERCVKPLPVVCKGDKVYIALKKGQIRLYVPALAREEGVKGDRIWVENIKSHKLIRVKIAEKGIVHLNEGESI